MTINKTSGDETVEPQEQPQFCTIRLEVKVHDDPRYWNDPLCGAQSFDVTLPINAFRAVDVNTVLPELINDAVSDYSKKRTE